MKHAVATAVTVAAVSILVGTLYLVLLAVAILTDGGIGSPATLPIGVLLSALLMTAVALAMFLPVTAAATQIRVRNNLHYLYEIPIAAFLLIAYILVVAVAIGPEIGALWYASGALLALLPTLGVYWLCLQSAGWLLTGAERVVAFVRRARGDGSEDDDRVRPY